MTTRDFLLPDLGEGLEDAEIVAWRGAGGERGGLAPVPGGGGTAKAPGGGPPPRAGAAGAPPRGRRPPRDRCGPRLRSVVWPGSSASTSRPWRRPARTVESPARTSSERHPRRPRPPAGRRRPRGRTAVSPFGASAG